MPDEDAPHEVSPSQFHPKTLHPSRASAPAPVLRRVILSSQGSMEALMTSVSSTKPAVHSTISALISCGPQAGHWAPSIASRVQDVRFRVWVGGLALSMGLVEALPRTV